MLGALLTPSISYSAESNKDKLPAVDEQYKRENSAVEEEADYVQESEYNSDTAYINDIEILGSNIIKPEYILSKMSLQKGDLYDKDAMQQDLKTIYRLGYFTERMKAIPVKNSNGTISLKIILEENIPVTETEYGKCYSYTARKKEIVYNANTYVAEVYSKLYYLTGTDFYRSEAIQCIDFTLHHQRNDGSWGYRLYPDGTEREQIDFHQGFIVNSLAEAIKYLRLDITNYTTALKKAYTFYMSKQFTESGKGLWRYPHMYPIDIHNQAVGVWIGSKYNSFAENENLKTKCDTILCWTMENMYNKRKGIFYYQKRRLFTNRIDYIRWNQAWMLLALVNNYKLHFDD